MKNWLQACLGAALISLSGGAFAQQAPQAQAVQIPSRRFALADAIRAMGQGHPLLAVARANYRAAEYDIVAAGLWTNPQLNAVYTRSLSSYTTYDPNLGYIQGGITQLIETAGLPRARKQAAQYALQATEAEGQAVRAGLVLDVQEAFVQLASAQRRFEILRDTAIRLERAQRIVLARVQAGAAPRYDEARITVALADARAALADAEADAVQARGALDVAVGPLASRLEGTADYDLDTVFDPPNIESLLQMMASSRPDIIAARKRAQSAQAQIEVARRSVFQGVNLYVGAGVGQSYGPDRQRQVDLSAGLTIPLPFIDRGQGTIPGAQARAQAAMSSADALILASEQRLRALYSEATHRRRALMAYRDTGATRKESMLQEAEVGYSEGRLSVLELVDAYLAVRDAQLRDTSLATDAQAALVSLWRELGRSLSQDTPGAS